MKCSFVPVFCLWVMGCAPSLAAPDSSTLLFDAHNPEHVGYIQATDARMVELDGAIEIVTGHEVPWPGVALPAPAQPWDLSPHWYVTVELSNPSDSAVRVFCRVDNPGADGSTGCVTGSALLRPYAQARIIVRLLSTPWHLSRPLPLIGMRGYPETADTLDPARVNQILLFLDKPKQAHRFRVTRITAGGRRKQVDADTFLPFVDQLGQYAHDSWPGKTHSLTELKEDGPAAEAEDLALHPGPSHRGRYGGWTDGPRAEGTGFFRVEKVRDTWWLIDPEGYLFWSHGVDCVHATAPTPISDREHYFAYLPDGNSPMAQFYGQGSWAPHGYYQDHTPYRTFDFYRANLFRVYGNDLTHAFNQRAHRRLRSWGLNTIGNWSDRGLCHMGGTPYTATISFNAPVIAGSTGYWGKFFDVFDPGFREGLARRLAEPGAIAPEDPWCIGTFVHNEIAWGDETSLALATLASPQEQPAKQVFLTDLKARHGSIEALNESWGTLHDDWNALAQCTEPPDPERAADDLAAFYDKIADTYFATIRQELKQAAPHHLYLGCRFAWVNDRAARAAARHCDVVSYNRYESTVADLRLPDSIDRPILIGEFHFGALDRGLFHTGLQPTLSQQERADHYRDYVRGALRNPQVVGTHWFQFKDQALTGRGDGENYQIGFLDVCDRPYPELVATTRDVADELYETRMAR